MMEVREPTLDYRLQEPTLVDAKITELIKQTTIHCCKFISCNNLQAPACHCNYLQFLSSQFILTYTAAVDTKFPKLW